MCTNSLYIQCFALMVDICSVPVSQYPNLASIVNCFRFKTAYKPSKCTVCNCMYEKVMIHAHCMCAVDVWIIDLYAV